MKSKFCIISISILMNGCMTTGMFPVCTWHPVSAEDLAVNCLDKDPTLNSCQTGKETCEIYVRNDLKRPDQVMCSPDGKVVDKKSAPVSTPAVKTPLGKGSFCEGGKLCD